MINDNVANRSGVQVLDGFASIAEAMSYLSLRNVKIIEINLNNPYFLAQLTTARDRKEIVRIVTGEGITWTAHLPEGMGFFAVEDEMFGRYLTWLVKMQEEANDTGARALTLHLGDAPHFAYSGQKRKASDLYREFYETTLFMRLSRASNLLRKGPPICIENVGGFHMKFVRDILSKVGGFSYTMDIGHLKAAQPKISEDEFEFFEEQKDALRVVHVHDNNKDWDAHLAVTDAQSLEPYLTLAKESDAYLVMEVRPLEAALSSLAVLTGVQR